MAFGESLDSLETYSIDPGNLDKVDDLVDDSDVVPLTKTSSLTAAFISPGITGIILQPLMR